MFAIAESAVKSITVSKTIIADEFIKNLSIDQNGNVQVVLTDDCQKNDDCLTESYFYNWSALDFTKKISLDRRLKILEELLEMFSRECTFPNCEYTPTKEEDVEPALWECFVVKIIYEKIGCDKIELIS